MQVAFGCYHQLSDVGALEVILSRLIVYLQAHRQHAIVGADQLLIVGNGFSEAEDLAALNNQLRSRVVHVCPSALHFDRKWRVPFKPFHD